MKYVKDCVCIIEKCRFKVLLKYKDKIAKCLMYVELPVFYSSFCKYIITFPYFNVYGTLT
jgi:hypothetical protein